MLHVTDRQLLQDLVSYTPVPYEDVQMSNDHMYLLKCSLTDKCSVIALSTLNKYQ